MTERAIAADIERTRAELGAAVAEIAARAHPGATVRQAATRLQDRARGGADQLAALGAGPARRYWPQLAAAAAALGLLLLAARKVRR